MYGQLPPHMDPPANSNATAARWSIGRRSGAFSVGSIQGSPNQKDWDLSIWEEEALDLVNGQPTVKLVPHYLLSINDACAFTRLPSGRVAYGPPSDEGICIFWLDACRSRIRQEIQRKTRYP